MAIYGGNGYRGYEPMLFNCITESVLPGARARITVKAAAYIVECNEDGYGTVTIDGKEYRIKPHSCYIVSPSDDVLYTSDVCEPRRGVFASLGGIRIGEVLSQIGLSNESPFIAPEHFERVRDILYRMRAALTERDGGAEYRRTALIYELLAAISYNAQTHDTETWVRRAVTVMETAYHTPLSVGDIAAQVGFERTYFSTVFKERTGMTPYEYLTALRIKKACELLRAGAPVGETAMSVGLDARNFSRVFKQVKGISPGEYKKKSKAAKN